MVFENAPWPFHEEWLRICHEHDEIMRFMDANDDLEDENWMGRRWKPLPKGKVNLCVNDSFRQGDGCMGSVV